MKNVPGFFFATSCTWILSSSARHGGSVRIEHKKVMTGNHINCYPKTLSQSMIFIIAIFFCARIDLFKKSYISFPLSLIDRGELW